MAIKPRPWTRADLERLPDDNNKYEVVRGELFVTPIESPRHQHVLYAIARVIREYVEPMKLGEVHQGRSSMVFEGSEVQPDITVYARPVPLPKKWDDMPIPFLVVEVLSEFTRRRDPVAKRSLYLDAGVAEYWIVDDSARSIRVVRHDVDQVVTGSLRWHPGGAPAPLVLDVAAVFRDALGSRYEELVASGRIRPALEAGDPFVDFANLKLPKGTAKALIDEDRDED